MREVKEWNPDFGGVVKETLRRNRWLRIGLIVLIGLWIVCGTRVITEHIIYRKHNLKEAMAVAKPGSTSGSVAFAARLEEPYLTQADQKKLIYYVAEKLGLTVTSEPEPVTDGYQEGFFFRKTAKHADTSIKVIERAENNQKPVYYLIVSLTLYADDGDGVVYYRTCFNEIAKELDVSEEHCSMQLVGRFGQGMTLAAKNRLSDRILKKLGCEIVCENREESLYTIYAYTNGINEYIVSAGERINVQLAMYYDEIKDETVLCVASPVISSQAVQTEQEQETKE